MSLIKKDPPRPEDSPDEILSGVCGTCKTDVTVHRYKAESSQDGRRFGRRSADWGDLPTTECPRCKATVYVTRFVLPRNLT